jgi:hypothetical protein
MLAAGSAAGTCLSDSEANIRIYQPQLLPSVHHHHLQSIWQTPFSKSQIPFVSLVLFAIAIIGIKQEMSFFLQVASTVVQASLNLPSLFRLAIRGTGSTALR